MDGFFTFLGEREVFIGDMISASFSDLGHALCFAIQSPVYPRPRRDTPTPPTRRRAARRGTESKMSLELARTTAGL
jgi:hypothetical protein